MSLYDGVDFDPNSVRQRVRHELGKTKMQAHVHGKETVRRELDGFSSDLALISRGLCYVDMHRPANWSSKEVGIKTHKRSRNCVIYRAHVAGLKRAETT